ncbi:MAG: insulinase family protein [Cyanobacteria bacterium SBLK]|nr:insulinase family protein [Cyanobacteria bacterium SBLK]
MQQLSQQRQTLSLPANTFRLNNGLTIVHQHLPTTPVAMVDVWVKAGVSAEPDRWYGMAHFLEHMIFKGSKRVAPGEFDREIENRGGVTNAATSHDYAHFFINTAAQYLPETLPYFAEILLHASIDDEEFVRERDVVIEEIRSCQDDPDWLGFQALCETVYGESAYGRSILGTEEQVRDRTPNQMRCFHKTHYQPENMTVAIVGGIDRETALALIGHTFSDFPVRSECPPRTFNPQPILTEICRTELRLPRLEQARLMMAWTASGVDSIREAVGLDMLSVFLGGGRSSCLVRELREEQRLVWDIASEFSLHRYSSLLTITAWLEEQYLGEVEQKIGDRLQKLQATPISDGELNRVKRLLLNDYAFSTETAGQLAGLYGYYNTIATTELSVAYPQRIEKMSAGELQAIAQKYLSSERYAVTVMKNL